MIIVVRDVDGDAYINLGDGRWAAASDVIRGKKYAEAWPWSLAELEREFGPLQIEWKTP